MKSGAVREGGAGGGRCGAAGFPERLRLNEKTGPTGREAPGEGHKMQEKELLQKAMQQKNMVVLYRDELVAPEYAGVPVGVENELVVL